MIRQTDITKCRIEFLKQFDYYVRNVIGDDEIICDIWLMEGLSDGYDETDLKEIALDDKLWLDCVKCFNKCCKAAGVIQRKKKDMQKKYEKMVDILCFQQYYNYRKRKERYSL